MKLVNPSSFNSNIEAALDISNYLILVDEDLLNLNYRNFRDILLTYCLQNIIVIYVTNAVRTCGTTPIAYIYK